MKKILKSLLLVALLCLYIYVYNIEIIPKNIVLMENEKLNLKTVLGLTLSGNTEYETALTSTNLNKESINKIGSNKVKVNLFGKFNVKDINVSVIPKTKVIPLGQSIGMKLYTKGVLVVGRTELEDNNKNIKKPYENSGIEEGDSILSINNNEINSTNDMVEQVEKSNGNNLNIRYSRNNKIMETSITPAKVGNDYKVGFWVRDATAGVGTLTFYEPSTNMFMSLGHGIEDIDTEQIVDISSGQLITANILSIVKGQKDIPGEIRGTITNGNIIGDIYKNTNFGVYGNVTNKSAIKLGDEIEVATRGEIKEGKATIICQVDNTSSPKEYEINIEKIYYNDNKDNKSMLIKITDENLLNKTGGIIQGMSGAPVLQNGKFIGAVTNVLVKDPTKGYAVFGDILIKQMRIVD